MTEWGEANGGDVAGNIAVKIFFGITFTYEVTLTVPSPIAATRGLMLFTAGLGTAVAPGPFDRASAQYDELAKTLTTQRDDLKDLIDKVGGGSDNLWTGPGAEAFNSYADKYLIDGLDSLISVAETTSAELATLAEGLWGSVTKATIIAYAVIIYQLALQAVQKIPVYGQIIFQALSAVGYIIEVALWLDTIIGLDAAFSAAAEREKVLADELDDLRSVFGKEAGSMESAASEVSSGDVGTILKDPEKWSKE